MPIGFDRRENLTRTLYERLKLRKRCFQTFDMSVSFEELAGRAKLLGRLAIGACKRQEQQRIDMAKKTSSTAVPMTLKELRTVPAHLQYAALIGNSR